MHEEFEVIRAQLRLAENDLNRGRPAKLGKRFHIITTKLNYILKEARAQATIQLKTGNTQQILKDEKYLWNQ